MTPLLVTLTLLLGALPEPCGNLERWRNHFRERAAQGAPAFESARNELEREVGQIPEPAAPGDAATPGERAEKLGQQLVSLCGWGFTPAARPDRQLLARILDRPEFAEAREDRSDLWAKVVGWIQNALAAFLQTRGMQGFASGTRALVLALAVAAVMFGTFRLITWRRGRRARSDREPLRAAVGPALLLDEPTVHLERARLLLAGAPREAIREALLALLSALERVRYAQPDRVRTNRELAQELPARGAPAPVSTEANRLFDWYDVAFYSMDPVRVGEAERFVSDVEGFGAILERAA